MDVLSIKNSRPSRVQMQSILPAKLQKHIFHFFLTLTNDAISMSYKTNKQYFIWVVINNNPLSLLHDGESYMPLEIAIEKVIKYIRTLSDSGDWKEGIASDQESVKWVNSKGDKISITESIQTQ